MSKKALVTGAAGFIGRHAALALQARGYDVFGLDVAEIPDPGQWGISHFTRSAVNLSVLENILGKHGKPWCVVHCAGSGSVPDSLKNPMRDFKLNVESVLAVLELSRLHNSEIRIVLPSSAAVYGNAGVLPLEEGLDCRPVSPYGAHKKIMEQLAASYGVNFAVPSICVRFFSIYGAGLRKQLLWDACNKLTRNSFSFFGTGRELRDWLHVKDATALLALAVDHAAPQAPLINGGTGKGVSVAQILTILGKAWQPKLQPKFTGEDRAGDPLHLVASVDRLTSWGFTPAINLQSGVADYVEWFKRETNNA